MSGYAAAQIQGRLGQDPQLRQTAKGGAMCTLSIATSRKVNQEEKTLWHKVLAFGKQAETPAAFLSKGREVLVHGHIDYDDYTNKDGVKCRVMVVIARDVVFGARAPERPAQAKPAPLTATPAPTPAPDDSFADDIPF